MWPYVTVFTISTILFKFSEYLKKKQAVVFRFIALLMLCVLAGLRESTIGTDTAGYLKPLITYAINSNNFSDYWNSSWIVSLWKTNFTYQYEPGFTIFIYIVARTTCSVIFTQTLLQFLVIFPVYKAIKKQGSIPLWFGMLIFDCLLFNHSLNMIRQSVAMSFVLLSFIYWTEGLKKKAVVLIVLATSFHLCGVIGLLIIFLYDFVVKDYKNGKKNKILRNRNFNIALMVGITLVLIANIIANILSQFGITRFLMYISGAVTIMPNQIIVRALGLILFLYNFKKISKNTNQESYFYLLMILYEILVSQFAGVNEYSLRIAQMFTVFDTISYPMACKYSKYKRVNTILMIMYLIFYWYFYFVLAGTAQTIPYEMINL